MSVLHGATAQQLEPFKPEESSRQSCVANAVEMTLTRLGEKKHTGLYGDLSPDPSPAGERSAETGIA